MPPRAVLARFLAALLPPVFLISLCLLLMLLPARCHAAGATNWPEPTDPPILAPACNSQACPMQVFLPFVSR